MVFGGWVVDDGQIFIVQYVGFDFVVVIWQSGFIGFSLSFFVIWVYCLVNMLCMFVFEEYDELRVFCNGRNDFWV